jgi:hypothetical protein
VNIFSSFFLLYNYKLNVLYETNNTSESSYFQNTIPIILLENISKVNVIPVEPDFVEVESDDEKIKDMIDTSLVPAFPTIDRDVIEMVSKHYLTQLNERKEWGEIDDIDVATFEFVKSKIKNGRRIKPSPSSFVREIRNTDGRTVRDYITNS